MPLKIEPIKSEELSVLVNMSRKTFYDTFYEHTTKEDMDLFLKTTFTEDILKQELCEPRNHFFFAKLSDEAVGYLKLSTSPNPDMPGKDVLEIARIYVLKEKLGAGIGKVLMEFAINFAKELKKKTIYLGVWEHNDRAIRFYKSWGFEKYDKHIFMVGNDAQTDWLMKRELDV